MVPASRNLGYVSHPVWSSKETFCTLIVSLLYGSYVTAALCPPSLDVTKKSSSERFIEGKEKDFDTSFLCLIF
ncbi:hypothetical protein CEXT_588301 [Caerostris extrusa]|uniref:Uncharacterized protein n=1 Tax=Caerostris extrusa TaxID=172846 RepID=A0AAV4Q7T9_CAEEX|nr:hypothetical protein CEXT_588301 [Caerostris extrusa]